MSQNDGWTPCPRCGSKKVDTSVKWSTAITLFAGAGIFIWLGLLFFVFFFVAFFCFILSLAMIFSPKQSSCKDCNHVWKQSKQTA